MSRTMIQYDLSCMITIMIYHKNDTRILRK